MISLTLQKMNITASELCNTAENVLGYYTEYSPVINFIQYASHFHYLWKLFSFSVTLRPKSSAVRLVVEVSRSHTRAHVRTRTNTRRVWLSWRSHQLVTGPVPTKDTKHKRWTSMPSAGFERAIQAVKWLQTYALWQLYCTVICGKLDKSKYFGKVQ